MAHAGIRDDLNILWILSLHISLFAVILKAQFTLKPWHIYIIPSLFQQQICDEE